MKRRDTCFIVEGHTHNMNIDRAEVRKLTQWQVEEGCHYEAEGHTQSLC